jgi:hypothetical protein
MTGLGDPEEFMTAVDAACILGLSSEMVRLLVRKGRQRAAIQTVRGARLFRRAEVESVAAERAQRVLERHERGNRRRRT